MKKLYSILGSLLLLGTLTACERDTTYDAFASCLDTSGADFYGAFWCHNCQDQKKLFGDSKDLLPYIECDPKGKEVNLQACALNGIEKYPTWIFKDGSRLLGVIPLQTLAEKTSCALPTEQK